MNKNSIVELLSTYGIKVVDSTGKPVLSDVEAYLLGQELIKLLPVMTVEKTRIRKKTFNVALVGNAFHNANIGSIGEKMTFKQEKDNMYDREAIAIYKENRKIGYVANSVKTNIHGCVSAGYVCGVLDTLCGKTENMNGTVKFLGSNVCIIEVELVY